MPLDFTGLHVAITGGTGALGSAVASAILDAGGFCHIPCMNPAKLKHFPFTAHDRVKVRMDVDLRSELGAVAYYASLPSLWASIHCAGGFAMSPFAQTPLAAFHEMLETNTVSCFLCCREAVKKINASAPASPLPRAGRIVNVAARPALEPRLGAGMVPYTVSKAAVAALTQALAQEVVDSGILVNAVVPSIMDTPANRRAMPDADFTRWPSLPAVAATIAFLASPLNTSTRGGLIPVYGAA